MASDRVRLRIALAQVNTTVGDVEGNAALVSEWGARAREAGAQLVIFPEHGHLSMITEIPRVSRDLASAF